MSKAMLQVLSGCLAGVKDKEELHPDNQSSDPKDEFVSTLWCLQNTVTGMVAQMPVPGAVVFFPSIDDAEEFYRLIAQGVGPWKARRVTRQDYKDFLAYTLWSSADPLRYTTIQIERRSSEPMV